MVKQIITDLIPTESGCDIIVRNLDPKIALEMMNYVDYKVLEQSLNPNELSNLEIDNYLIETIIKNVTFCKKCIDISQLIELAKNILRESTSGAIQAKYAISTTDFYESELRRYFQDFGHKTKVFYYKIRLLKCDTLINLIKTRFKINGLPVLIFGQTKFGMASIKQSLIIGEINA